MSSPVPPPPEPSRRRVDLDRLRDADRPTRFLPRLGELDDLPGGPGPAFDPRAAARRALAARDAARDATSYDPVEDPYYDEPRVRAEGYGTLVVMVALAVLLLVVVLCFVPGP